MISKKAPHPRLIIAAMLAIQSLFGINYIASKVVVDAFPPLLWGSARMIIAAIIMTGIALILKRPYPRGGRRFYGPLLIFSLLGIVINQAAFLVGLSLTSPSNSAILNTLTPVFTLLVVTLMGQEKFNWRKIIGFIFALAGVLILRRVEEFSFNDKTAVGDLLIILNCLSFSCFITFSKKFLEKYDQFWSTAWLFIFGSIGLTFLAAPDWIRFQWPTMTPLLWVCTLYAILAGTLATYFLNNWALKHTQSSQVALFIYIQPVIAIGLATLLLREPLTPRTIASCLVIFLGVLIALFQRRVYK